MIEFKMPSLGADMEDGILAEWRVKPGDTVKKGDIIAEVETQKGTIEIEVFEEGVIERILLEKGVRVPVGTVMAHLSGESKTAVSEKSTIPVLKDPIIESESAKSNQGTTTTIPDQKISVRASPLARKMAEEKGIEISSIRGTGPEGVVTKDDVEKAVSERIAVPREIEPYKTDTSAENIRMAVAAAMSRSNREIPHYYLATRADMSASLAWLAKTNRNLTIKERLLPAALVIKAVAKALENVPDLNAWWMNGLLLKKEINIGFVVSLRTGGLMIPAIHDCRNKSISELMKSLNDIIPRARALKLRSSELSESTITISNLGDEGVETIYGVIYPPQVAIVGVGKITEQVLAINGMITVRPILTLTLAADHRATDGNTGSRFLNEVKKHLEHPELL